MACFLGWFSSSSGYELEFPQFLKQYNLLMLPISTDDIVPGAVLDTNGLFGKSFSYQGHLNELMPKIPDSFWETEMDRANLVNGSVKHSTSLRGKSGLAQWGISVAGGLESAKAANFRITGIHGRSFANGKGHASSLTLRPLLSRLKTVHEEAYETLINDWIVMETYYASECVVELEGNGSVQADVQKAGGIQVAGGGMAEWKSGTSFVVSQNVEVPFAFSGFRVRRW